MRLFDGLFDDAALYPPASTPLPEAMRAHAVHRAAPYAALVGPFVCSAGVLAEVDALAEGPLDVAVVADGLAGVEAARREFSRVRVVAVEVRGARVADVAGAVDVPTYVEVPVARVDDAVVGDLAAAGLRLKLRTGGVTAEAFPSEAELAAAIARCVAAGLPAKCTAGLHHAVRHRDPRTGFEHHGFLNVLLAFHGEADALAEQDANIVAKAVQALTGEDTRRVRELFRSFGTCSIAEPLADLATLGLA